MSKLFDSKLYLANHFQSLKAEIDYAIEMKLKEKELKERGKKVSIWGGGRMILTFDVNTYKVINFESDWGLKAFKEHFMDLQIP